MLLKGKLFLFKKQKRTAIILKDHVIRYVDSRRPSLDEVKSYSERFLPPGIIEDGKIVERDILLTILDECIDRWNINKREIQFCVPDSSVVIRNISVPKTVERNRIHIHLFMEIGESIHLPFEDPIFDYHIIGENEKEYRILIIASREKIVYEFNDLFEELSLRPNAADILPLSIYRLLYILNKVQQDEHVLLVQYDISSLNLTVFHNHFPLFSRYFPASNDVEKMKSKTEDGTERLIWVVEVEEIKKQAEELIREVGRVMDYYRFSVQKGRAGITKIIIVGDHPELRQVIRTCKEKMDIPIDDLNDLEKEGFPHYYYDVLGLMLKKEVQ